MTHTENRHIIATTKRQVLAINPRTKDILVVKQGDEDKIVAAYACNSGIFHASPYREGVKVHNSVSGKSVHTIQPQHVAKAVFGDIHNKAHAMATLDHALQNIESGILVDVDGSFEYHIPIGDVTGTDIHKRPYLPIVVFPNLPGHIQNSGLKIGPKSIMFDGRVVAMLKPTQYGGRISYAQEIESDALESMFRSYRKDELSARKSFFTK